MYLGIAKKVFSDVWFKFDYVEDLRQYDMSEHWTSHAAAVLEGKRFKDDCDGFALTCAELLINASVPRSRVSVIYCLTETGGGHLVCGIATDASTYILDNRYTRIYEWKKRPEYKFIKYMTFDEVGKWYNIK